MKVEQFDKATHAKHEFENITDKKAATAFLIRTLKETPALLATDGTYTKKCYEWLGDLDLFFELAKNGALLTKKQHEMLLLKHQAQYLEILPFLKYLPGSISYDVGTEGFLDAAKVLIDHPQFDKTRALAQALECNHLPLAKFLMEQGASITDDVIRASRAPRLYCNSTNPRVIAVEKEKVERLTSKKRPLFEHILSGMPHKSACAMAAACTYRDYELIQEMLRAGYAFNGRELDDAKERNDMELFQFLLKLKAPDRNGYATYECIIHEQYPVLRMMVDAGYSLDVAVERYIPQFKHAAKLIERLVDEFGYKPSQKVMDQAVHYGNTALVKYLFPFGLKITREMTKYTHIDNSDFSFFYFLIESGAEIHPGIYSALVTGFGGNREVAEAKIIELIKYFHEERGLPIPQNNTEPGFNDLLGYALQNGYYQVARYFIEHGVTDTYRKLHQYPPELVRLIFDKNPRQIDNLLYKTLKEHPYVQSKNKSSHCCNARLNPCAFSANGEIISADWQ